MAILSINTVAATPSVAAIKPVLVTQAPAITTSLVSSAGAALVTSAATKTIAGISSPAVPSVSLNQAQSLGTAKVDAVAQTAVNALVSGINQAQTPVAQTQSLTVAAATSISEKAAASFSGITTPGSVTTPGYSTTVPAGDAVKLAATVLAPVAVDLSKISVSVGDGAVSASSLLAIGKDVLNVSDNKVIPGTSEPVTSPIKGVSASATLTALADKAGIQNTQVDIPQITIDKVVVPAQNVSTEAVKLAQALAIKTNPVEINGVGDKAIGVQSYTLNAADLIKVAPQQLNTPAVTVDPQPVAVGKIAADASASVVAKVVAATQVTLPVPAATPEITLNAGKYVKPGELALSTQDLIKTDTLLNVNKPISQTIGTTDNISAAKMVTLPGIAADGLLDGATSGSSASDVLTVSKFAVTVANVNPAIKVDHVSQSVSYDLDHAYTVPSVALNPYAGHTDAPASADAYAHKMVSYDTSEHVQLVAAQTTNPVYIG